MTKTTLAALIAGTFFLLGCSETGQYPITGAAVGDGDQVQFMSAPTNLARY